MVAVVFLLTKFRLVCWSNVLILCVCVCVCVFGGGGRYSRDVVLHSCMCSLSKHLVKQCSVYCEINGLSAASPCWSVGPV
jgi:hypothetical protein